MSIYRNSMAVNQLVSLLLAFMFGFFIFTLQIFIMFLSYAFLLFSIFVCFLHTQPLLVGHNFSVFSLVFSLLFTMLSPMQYFSFFFKLSFFLHGSGLRKPIHFQINMNVNKSCFFSIGLMGDLIKNFVRINFISVL